MNKIKCIYAIKDKRNDKVVYIGQTVDFKKRKQDHFSAAITYIDNYMYEQGRDNFEMYVLEELNEEVSEEEMKKLETYYIKKEDVLNTGLNKRLSFVTDKERRTYLTNFDKEYKNKNKEKWKQYHNDYMKEYRKSEEYKEYKRQYYLNNKDKYNK